MKATQPPLEYLLTSSETCLEGFELARQNQIANVRKEIQDAINDWVVAETDARISRWILDCRRGQISSDAPAIPRLNACADEKLPPLAAAPHFNLLEANAITVNPGSGFSPDSPTSRISTKLFDIEDSDHQQRLELASTADRSAPPASPIDLSLERLNPCPPAQLTLRLTPPADIHGQSPAAASSQAIGSRLSNRKALADFAPPTVAAPSPQRFENLEFDFDAVARVPQKPFAFTSLQSLENGLLRFTAVACLRSRSHARHTSSLANAATPRFALPLSASTAAKLPHPESCLSHPVASQNNVPKALVPRSNVIPIEFHRDRNRRRRYSAAPLKFGRSSQARASSPRGAFRSTHAAHKTAPRSHRIA